LPIALYTKMDAKYDKQVTVVGLLLTTLGDGERAAWLLKVHRGVRHRC